MSALDKIMARLNVANDDAPCWIERGRDLHTPYPFGLLKSI